MTTTKRISARLPADVVERLDCAARAERRTFTGQLAHVLDRALDKGTPVNLARNLTSTAAPPAAAQPTPVKKRGSTLENHAPSTRRSVEESPTDAPTSLRDGVK